MNNNRRNETVSMNKTPVYIALVVSAFIMLCGSGVAYRYVGGVYLPTMTALKDVFAIRTSQAQTTTSIAVSVQAATQTAQTSTKAAIQTAEYEKSLTYAAQTAVAQTKFALENPTNTPTPNLVPTCQAKTVNETWIFQQPGFTSQPGIAVYVHEDTNVIVDGRLRDQAWVHVIMGDKRGFIRRDALMFDDTNCAPVIADLHFLAGWLLEPGWGVLVDDTAFVGPTRWMMNNNQPLPTSSIGDESALHVSANTQGDAFSIEALRQAQASAFDLRTYFTAQRVGAGSYIGIRFYAKDGSYYEVRFLPYSKECSYSIHENTTVVYSSDFSKIVCAYGTYAIHLAVDERHNLRLVVNGAESTSVQINSLKGGINFSVYNFVADFNYIVVTVPR